MAEQKQGKKNRKIGRQAKHPAHVNYTRSHQRERNKIKRIAKSNGHNAAVEYSKKFSEKGIVVKVPQE